MLEGRYTLLVMITCYTCSWALPVYNIQKHPKYYLPNYVSEFSGRRHLPGNKGQDSLSKFHLRIGDPAKSFVSAAEGRYINDHGHPVFLYTLKRYPGVFLPNGSKMTQPFRTVVKEIYEYSIQNWRKQQETIRLDLQTRFGSLADKYLNKNKHALFLTALVTMYTDDSFYRDLNTLLRTGNIALQNSLGSLGLMLNVALLQWPKLSKFNKRTYRGMGYQFKPYVMEYKAGMSFAWKCFISSSSEKLVGCGFARSAIFVIDNTAMSDWAPRQVQNFSVYSGEYEVLYPISSVFRITDVEKNSDFCLDKNLTKLSISLQQPLID